MTFHPTSTAGVNIAVSACEVGANDEPGALLSLCLGQQPKLSARVLDVEFLAVMRDWAEKRGYVLTVRKAAPADDGFERDDRYCGHCDRDTPHKCRYSRHERDSSDDYVECLVCHWYATGMSSEYQPGIGDE